MLPHRTRFVALAFALAAAPAHASATPPSNYLGCFRDLDGGYRDLPFFWCSNGTLPAAQGGVNACGPDPRLGARAAGGLHHDGDAAAAAAPSSSLFATVMSPGLCATLCAKTQYYAVQNGTGCFCGNSYGAFGAAPEAECSAACSDAAAAAGARCGGPLRNSVYNRTQPPPPSPSQSLLDAPPGRVAPAAGAPVVPLQRPSGAAPFKALGCYKDVQAPTFNRDLGVYFCVNGRQWWPGEIGPTWDTAGCADLFQYGHGGRYNQINPQAVADWMTLELCDAVCTGFAYFAVGGGQQCFCGDAYGRYGPAPSSDCSTPCTGDKSETCGGGQRNSVFARNQNPTGAGATHHQGGAAAAAAAAVPMPATREQFEAAEAAGTAAAADPEPVPVPESESVLEARRRRRGRGARLGVHLHSGEALAASVDWASLGKVTPAPDLAACEHGSWAYAAVGAIESANAINGSKQLVAMSAGSLLDCGWNTGGQGCAGGGSVARAFEYVWEYGLCTAASYKPYAPVRQTSAYQCCKTSQCGVVVPFNEHGGFLGFVDVQPGNESALLSAVALAPVAVSLAVDAAAWRNYSGKGVVTGAPCLDAAAASAPGAANAAALVVGYGTTGAGEAYWKVRASFGAAWGDGSGYALVARGGAHGADAGTGRGACGILAMPQLPLVADAPPASDDDDDAHGHHGSHSWPPPRAPHHYGVPPCLKEEVEVHVGGLSEGLCSHTCSKRVPCPQDRGRGVGMPAQCNLLDPKTNTTFCSIVCQSDCDCAWNQVCVTSAALPFAICMGPSAQAGRASASAGGERRVEPVAAGGRYQ